PKPPGPITSRRSHAWHDCCATRTSPASCANHATWRHSMPCSRCRPQAQPERPEALMHAYRLELLAPGIRNRSLAAVGEHDRSTVGGMQGVQQCPRRKLRRLRELPLHVFGADRLEVGDLAVA